MIYNMSINQIATVCVDACLKVWEADTGRIMYTLNNIHGKNIEVSCMALNAGGYRLVTAGHDCSLKLWDFRAGQELKHKLGKNIITDDSKYSNIIYTKINEEFYIITFSGNNIVKLFHVSFSMNFSCFCFSFTRSEINRRFYSIFQMKRTQMNQMTLYL